MAGENPYPWNGVALRWVQGNPTDETRMNIARIHIDHLYTALTALLDTAYSGLIGTWENPIDLGGASGLHLWYDATNGIFRYTTGSDPSSETDGTAVSTAGSALATHPSSVSEDTTVAADQNAVSAGPITVDSGITVTLSPGATWVIV